MSSTIETFAAVPSGYRAPLALIDADHHAPRLLITTALGVVVILLTLIIRVYIRLRISPPFAADDFTLTAATALALIESALIFSQVHNGFGTSINLVAGQKLDPIQKVSKAQYIDLEGSTAADNDKLGYAADIFYIIVLYCSKAGVVLLFRRIASGVQRIRAAWIVLAVSLALGVISIFLVALRCNLSHPWIQYSQSCPSLAAQWKVIAAFDIVTEVALFALAIQLVWGLQTQFSRKTRVVFAFGLRLPVIIIAAIHLNYVTKEINSSNPTLTGVNSSVLRQVELFYAIMASTIPCLRPFLAGFATNYGAMGVDTVIAGSQVGNSSGHRGEKGSSNFAMMSMQSSSAGPLPATGKGKGRMSRSQRRLSDNDRGMRSDHPTHRTSISHETVHGGKGADASSVSSDNSTRMIIKKEVQWHVNSDSVSRDAMYDTQGRRQ